MSNKKDLKKTINYICSELFAECVAASLYNGKPNEDSVNALLSSILMIQNDYVRRISHPEPGMKQKEYFKNLIDDFNKQTSEIIDQIASLQ
ncbi:MAG: hypothetical protein IKX61_04215 [Prevotella sp.]|nr:hypothetical protein [Prevotella sp.]